MLSKAENTIKETLETLEILRNLNLRDYKDTKDVYFKGKADAYLIAIRHIKGMEGE
jgi:hypothetical protein